MTTNNNQTNNNNNDGTAELLEALIPMVIPLVCKQVSQSLIDAENPSLTVLHNEEPIPKGDPVKVLKDIQLTFGSISIVDESTLTKDMEQMPTFAWPEATRYSQLLKDQRMTVLDIQDLTLTILLGPAIEFAIPTVSSFGQQVLLEVGCGGDLIGDNAHFKLHLPKVRVWMVLNEQVLQPPQTQTHIYTKVFVAFLGRPNLTPHLHINADRGKGDFFQLDFHEQGSLDDVVESVLLGFGPAELEQQAERAKNNMNSQQNWVGEQLRNVLGHVGLGGNAEVESQQDDARSKQSWVGNALGEQLRKALGQFVGLGGNKPLEVDLTESITDAVRGKPRQVAAIEADLERLQLELEAAKAYYEEHPDEIKQVVEPKEEEQK